MMTEHVWSLLDQIRRLGKSERQQLRDVLVEASAKGDVERRIGELLEKADTIQSDLEDVFIFGAQMATVWPDGELVLKVSEVTPTTVAFVHGFFGMAFETCFAPDALARLRHTSPDLSAQRPTSTRQHRDANLGSSNPPSMVQTLSDGAKILTLPARAAA